MTLGRYLLLVDWSKVSIEPVAARMQDRLQCQTRLADHDCIILANDPGQLLAMPGERGMIIGTVFPRHGPASAVESSDRLWLEELDAPDPLTLLRDRFWGGYVGFDWQSGVLRLFRDPGGAMPCYYMALPTGWAVSSDAEMLVEAGLLSPRIDWAEMPRYLTSKDLPSGRTGIEGLMELLAGSCVTLGSTMSVPTQYWSPWDHVAECDGWDGDAMAERLRRTVDHCVASWASTSDRTLATLSGDSIPRSWLRASPGRNAISNVRRWLPVTASATRENMPAPWRLMRAQTFTKPIMIMMTSIWTDPSRGISPNRSARCTRQPSMPRS